jgi:hypothetical protein
MPIVMSGAASTRRTASHGMEAALQALGISNIVKPDQKWEIR